MIIYRIFLQIKEWGRWVGYGQFCLLLWVVCLGLYAFCWGVEFATARTPQSSIVRQGENVALSLPGLETASTTQDEQKLIQTGQFTASKNGTKYYLSTCAAAGRIKAENRIYFATENQAIAAGFGKALTC